MYLVYEEQNAQAGEQDMKTNSLNMPRFCLEWTEQAEFTEAAEKFR